jgi:CheY-like chemotaxis protein
MSKKLLLADDSITIQKVIQITFAHEDYELTITDNGDAALAKAQEIKPDLIMTDIYMPGKNGYELTSAIKQDPALRHVPVLLLAGSFEPFDEDKARSCKADAWIEKPFESQSLIDKVAELLSAAQPAPAAPAPVAEPEAVAALEPTAVADVVFEETPLAAFDEPVSAVPEMAAAEDPFGDISFEDETPAAEPEPVAAADDWSEVAAEPAAAAPVVEDAFAGAEDFAFSEEEAAAEVVEDFSFAEEEPVAEIEEDFSFAGEQPVTADAFAPLEEAPLAEPDFDAFDMDEDEIMPLGDDDILGAEDLEPAMPEQTLAAWSRDESAVEEIFAEPLEEEPEVARETGFGAPVEEAAVFFDDEPVAEATPVFEEPVVEPAAVAEETEPAAPTAALEVAARASALSEEDVEKIIEKIVTQVVEKLAGSILERVAWDVVPDLAENLIREEIRKIKDAAA